MDEYLLELEPERPEDRERRDRRRRLVAAGGLAGLAFVGIGLSSALFSDTDTLGSNSFTSGSVTIGTNPGTAAVSAGNMAPGDVVYGNVAVNNNGSLRFRYAVTASADDTDGKNLRSQLRISAYSGVTPFNCAAGNVGGGTLLGGPVAVGSSVQLVGNIADVNDPGNRELSAAAGEDLCFRVALPLATGNAFQNATSEITLTFDAEQVKNNP
jgi:hypothetical protein